MTNCYMVTSSGTAERSHGTLTLLPLSTFWPCLHPTTFNMNSVLIDHLPPHVEPGQISFTRGITVTGRNQAIHPNLYRLIQQFLDL